MFGLILALNRLRLHLGLALLAGSLVLGLWMGMGPLGFGLSVLKSLSSLQTISLFLIVGLIMVMSRIMEESGHMARLVRSFARLSRDPRIVGSVMSALIGLLPMPGGALFSAPMVQASLSSAPATSDQKAALNYWFRHIWEYWWPLYPGVILAVALLEVDTWHFMLFMAPMTLVSLGAGTFFILRPMGKAGTDRKKGVSWDGIRQFIREMMPVLIVIISMAVLTGLFGILEFMGIKIKIVPILLILPGLLASIAWVCHVNHSSFSQIRSATFRGGNLIMLFLIIAVMIFKGVMEDSAAVVQIRNELMTYRIPVVLLILMMPFLSGFILGIAVGFVGASFPLIIPLIQSPDLKEFLLYAGLAYTFGYVGMMLSPVHICLLVTKDYFKAGLLDSYRYIVKTGLTVLIAAVLLFLIVRTL